MSIQLQYVTILNLLEIARMTLLFSYIYVISKLSA